MVTSPESGTEQHTTPIGEEIAEMDVFQIRDETGVTMSADLVQVSRLIDHAERYTDDYTVTRSGNDMLRAWYDLDYHPTHVAAGKHGTTRIGCPHAIVSTAERRIIDLIP